MRAVTCTQGRLEVAEVPDLRPVAGQLVLDVLRCGICGSDLHARTHCDELADVMVESGYDGFMRSDHAVVFGHEFVGRVTGSGAGAKGLTEGTTVVSLPLRRTGGAVHLTGLSVAAPGAYAEQVLVEASLTWPVPNGLSVDAAALTEPMAIGYHAVRRSEITRRRTAVVIGCGPIGLATIIALKERGVHHVIASDPSLRRRALALACHADVVVDPTEQSPYDLVTARGTLRSLPEVTELGVGLMERVRRLPIPWEPLLRLGERAGLGPAGPVVFECVGTPGMIDGIVTAAPFWTRVVVVGVCMGADHFRPAMAINKEIDLRFVLGYTPLEFRDTLRLIADGRLDPLPLVTGTVGLGGVSAAFDDLGTAGSHAKVLIDPAGTD